MKISSGSMFVDGLLDGGYESDVITTIYGPPGSGKTNFCLLAMANLPEKKILYVDTEGSFSLARFKQVCKDYEEVLNRTVFLTPTTYAEQKDAFEFMKKSIDEKFGLIIVDSIASLYRLELGISNDIQNVNRELSLHMALLTEIARKKRIPVIMTNQVYADMDDKDKVKTVGGDVIRYWSRVLIELQKLKGDLRKIIITKHRSIKEGNFSVYRIVQDGVEEVKG
ncbi:TPA: DNA repair and recombination protein RadB [Candidatus Woesearchaeota archaeon]|nr:DNA repair and recombination protein RadB [Candidatus Woesearchaeota archaeon]HIH31617.1 DNA repair and recombination protein RadB [Candidatus Woesearchaeota archaeon]HIH55349.1 DNA repair and recombination protein RadB [Candidatus Woesearchaeota archaeon]HIJ01187.1 DNA repair and recombination protein RadB [Candidatus Woesearchaeota archaeon]HIJ14011.1 DNA repair and recombination protein RadB [Candidatus Woesearchaeota archaeon]